MRIKVLGSAAGGGFPQWNCGCSNCSSFRSGSFKGGARTQAQLAVFPVTGVSILLNASPDLRQQILSDRELAPAGRRDTPICAVILTSADTDSVLGLLHLREFQPLRIFATNSVRRILTEENSLFRTLERSSPPVCWETLPLDRLLSISSETGVGSPAESAVCCRAVSLDGDFPDYVSEGLRAGLRKEEAVVSLVLTHGGKMLVYAPSVPALSPGFRALVEGSDLALMDGTFWTDTELQDTRGAGKKAREIGHVPLSEPDGLLRQIGAAPKTRRVLVHINNTNPVLDEESAAHRAVVAAGWEVAFDGMELNL